MQSRWYTNHSDIRREEYGGLRQETGRERYYRQIREIQDTLGISHDQARQRWRDYYAPGGAPIKPIKKITLAIRASTTNQRTCPFCRDSIFHPDEGGPDYVCTSCQAHYHLDCFEDELGGRCATLGCSTRRVIDQARLRIRTRGHNQQPQTARERPQTAQTAQDPDETERVPQAPREALWLRIFNWPWLPVVTLSIILLVFLTMVIANGMAG